MTTQLTLHISSAFLTYVTGSPNGIPPSGVTQNGSWVYLYQTDPPDGQDAWTPIVELGQIVTSNVQPSGDDYIVNVELTNTQTPTVDSAAIYLIIQGADPTNHTPLPSVIDSETDIQPKAKDHYYSYVAFEYALLNQAADQGDITYIDGFGPHLAVKIGDDSRGIGPTGAQFLQDLNSPSGAVFQFQSGSSGLPFSALDGKPSFAVSPSNGTFGGDYFSPSDWDAYLNAVVTATTPVTFSGTTSGSPDASAVYHNGAYYSYSVSQVQTTSDPGTNYVLFTAAPNSQTQGYMLIKQSDVAANLYAPGQGSALGRMYSTAVFTNGLFDDTLSTPYIVPGSAAIPGEQPTTNQFNVSGNNQWGNALTQFFTGFTAGYWGAEANQANPANNGGAAVDLGSTINWGPAYAFDKNRSNAIPSYQHNDQYSYQYYLHANAYASAFSDNLAKQLNPGPQISLSNGNQNVSQIDLFVYAPSETDGLFQEPVGANYVAAPAGGYLIPGSVAAPTSTSLILQIQGFNTYSTLAADAVVHLGIYAGQDGIGHATFEYVALPGNNGSVFGNYTIGGSPGAWTAAWSGSQTQAFIQIDNLPTATAAMGDVYWFQLVVGNSANTFSKVFNVYATTDANGNFQLFNPANGQGTANDPLAATDGNALILVNNPTMLTYSLQPDQSLPVGLLTNGFAPTANGHGGTYTALAAPVVGIWTDPSTFAPVAGQNGTGVTAAQGYVQTEISGTLYNNPAPSVTITTSPVVSFGWTGTNNVAWNEAEAILPTWAVFQDSAPYHIVVPGQVSQFSNKITPGNVAKITFSGSGSGLALTAVADLDGQWTTGGSVRLGNGAFSATMQEMFPNGTAPFSTLTSVPVAITIQLAQMSFESTPGAGYLQLDPGQTGAEGNWIKLSTTGSNMPNGTLLVYATDASGNLIGRDGTVGVTLEEAVLARIGSVAFDDGTTMLQGEQAVYLEAGRQLHFAVQTGDGTIDQIPGVLVTGAGQSMSVQVSGSYGTLDLSAVVDNTLGADSYLASSQRDYDQPWMHLNNGQTIHAELAGSAHNINTVHFVRIDVDPATGDWSVGGQAYGNTDAFRAAVIQNWDPNFAITGGRGDFLVEHDWTVSTGTGYYVPVLLTEGGDIFVVGTANVDGRDHIRMYGENMFGFEDLRADQGSDFDYNDQVMKLSVL